MSSFKKIYHDIATAGKDVAPRGLPCKELLNYSYELRPYERFANFPSRKLSLDYIRHELQWYMKGERADLSICDHAKIWRDCVTDGLIHSNYGHYLFQQGRLEYVVDCLKKDRDSRRAVMTILGGEHLFHRNRDVPCTVSIGLRIRGTELLATVHMRSQDAIFGLGNDAPFFSVVQEMAFKLLQEVYSELSLGPLHAFVESLHVYQRHYKMLDKLLTEEVEPMEIPKIESAGEVRNLLTHQRDLFYGFTGWLYAA